MKAACPAGAEPEAVVGPEGADMGAGPEGADMGAAPGPDGADIGAEPDEADIGAEPEGADMGGAVGLAAPGTAKAPPCWAAGPPGAPIG